MAFIYPDAQRHQYTCLHARSSPSSIAFVCEYMRTRMYVCMLLGAAGLGPVQAQAIRKRVNALMESTIQEITSLILVSMVLVHYIACGFLFIARLEILDNNWLTAYEDMYSIDGAHTARFKYLAAVYWSFTTVCSVSSTPGSVGCAGLRTFFFSCR